MRFASAVSLAGVAGLIGMFLDAPMRAENPVIGNHRAVYDPGGLLRPWTDWTDALDREMNWYQKCPLENGYPRFVFTTFMDGNYEPQKDASFIPAMQNGVGIISYLKYYAWNAEITGRKNPKFLQFARYMGDYLVKESLTPDTGKYPRFPRSTGTRAKFPQPPDSGTQADQPYEIEPDKGGIAGYALVLLFDETKDRKYLDQALQTARVLAANMAPGDEHQSPWPFRVDYRTGTPRGPVAANMSFNLRLFDILLDHGYGEFLEPRTKLWSWIKNFQIPALKDGSLWVQFFEDHQEPDNRNAWSPLNLARYLLEKKAALDPDWQQDAKALIEFTIRNFTSIRSGVPVCGEQTYDKEPWGGILSSYGAVLAMYTAATGSDEYKALAYQALNYVIYAINDDGCPRENALTHGRGGWQEDAHTDKIHNFVDAMKAFPEWATRRK
jgi:hypothetical protein